MEQSDQTSLLPFCAAPLPEMHISTGIPTRSLFPEQEKGFLPHPALLAIVHKLNFCMAAPLMAVPWKKVTGLDSLAVDQALS